MFPLGSFTQQAIINGPTVCSITLSGTNAIAAGYNPMDISGQTATYTLVSPANVWLADAPLRSKPTVGSILAEVKVSGTGGGAPAATISDATFAYRVLAGRDRTSGDTVIAVISAGSPVYADTIAPTSKIALGVNAAGDPLIFVDGVPVDLGGAGAGMFSARDFAPVCIDLDMQTSGTGSVEWITAGANFESQYIGTGLLDWCDSDTVPKFDPLSLGAKLLAWYDPDDLSSLAQLSDGTGAVAADGDPVGYVADKSGNGYHWTQPTTTKRFTYRTDGTYHWLELDRVDDQMVATFPSSKSGTFIQAYTGGVLSGELTTGTTWTHPTVATRTPVSGIGQLILCDGVLTTGEKALAVEYSKAFASSDNFAGATSWNQWWRSRADITELDFSEIDASSAAQLFLTFDSTGITSFGPLTISPSATDFRNAWSNTPLSTLDTTIFDNLTNLTIMSNCLSATNLTQQAIDDVLVSIDGIGTSSGTFLQSGGSAPSATGEAAIDALRGRGWTVTVAGGY